MQVILIIAFLLFLWFVTKSFQELIQQSKLKKESKPTNSEDIDAYITRLKDMLKKAEEDSLRGIESAESSIQFYKDQLKKVTETKQKSQQLKL